MAKMGDKVGGSFVGVNGLKRYGIRLEMDIMNNPTSDADTFLYHYYR